MQFSMRSKKLVRILFHIAAMTSWVSLPFLFLCLSSDRPRMRIFESEQHFIAYFIVAALTRAALTHIQSRFQLAAFIISAGTFELVQNLILGRTQGLTNWAASSFGALLGIISVRTVIHFSLARKQRQIHTRKKSSSVANLPK